MKKSWLDRFSQAARWYLPVAEADEVIADYREMLAGDGRTEEERYADLGRSQDAAKLLVQPKPYRAWVTVFALLAVCLVLPGISPLPLIDPRLWGNMFGRLSLSRPLVLVGAVGAVVWFRRKGRHGERMPGMISAVLVILLVYLAVLMGFNWLWMHEWIDWDALGRVASFIRIDPYTFTTSLLSALVSNTMEWFGGLGMVILGVCALIKARTEDRRWAAVYVLAMTAMLVSLSTLALITSMDTSVFSTDDVWQWFSGFFYTYAAMAAAGLVGAGVALC